MTIDPNAFIFNSDIKYIKQKVLQNLVQWSGVGNSPNFEIKTTYDAGLAEDVKGVGNSYIIMGYDRDGGKLSGYGGKGFSGASSIDLIAGLSGPYPTDRNKTKKSFTNDAARIYLSQMADIDRYFNIPAKEAIAASSNFKIENSVSKSGIGIKADNIRLIARENIKLVTFHNVINSQSKKSIKNGIDIIAGIDFVGIDKKFSIQPMVKGNNLLSLIKEIITAIKKVEDNLSNFITAQNNINNILSAHVHQSGKAGAPTSTIIGANGSVQNFKLLKDSIAEFIFNMADRIKIQAAYTDSKSPLYINSMFNNVN